MNYKQKITNLKKKIERLKQIIERLKMSRGKNLLRQKLIERGLIVYRKNKKNKLFLPKQCSSKIKNEFYQLLLKYSFRLFLRDVIRYKDNLKIDKLTRYCSINTVKKYFLILEKHNLVKKIKGGDYQLLVTPIYNFGPTLEWAIVQLFKKEFGIESYLNVSFANDNKGGDFDVIGILDQNLIYAEVKSSPPKHIEENEVGTFLERINLLSPDIGFFFNDTHLRMKDKIVAMFENILPKVYPRSKFHITRLEKEIFHINHKIYILNSKGSITRNFRLCFKDFALFFKEKSSIILSFKEGEKHE